MTDDTAPILDPAETATVPVVPDRTAESPPASAEPSAAPDDLALVEDLVEVKGEKYVPVKAVAEARRDAKALKQRIAELEPAAQKAAQLEAYLQGVAPYLQALQTHARSTPEPTPPPAVPDERADAFARKLELYRADGTPDTTRGREILTLIEDTADQKAQRAVQPVMSQTAQREAETNYRRALATKDRRGRAVKPDILSYMWRQFPAELTANEAVAGVIWRTAYAEQYAHEAEGPAPAPHEPLLSERSGGRPAGTPGLLPWQERIAKDRGIAPAKFAETVAQSRPDLPLIMEE